MAQVNVTIAGRVFRMACGEGEEKHLTALAERLDARIATLRRDFGEIGDQRITVMAAITLVDDLSDAESRLAALKSEMAMLQEERDTQAGQLARVTDAVVGALDGVVDEIDRVTRTVDRGRGAAAR